ncbi:hypothetical protein [Nocardioides taihuensis]|uniref:Uncharacterized protein n=1 Tax=Nocardioides taihuensis TaxID=1835606 RepID=A0ABW0BNB5_9ACTN
MRVAPVIGALVLGAGLLTGCGGGDSGESSSYCDDLKSAQEEFAAFDSDNPDMADLDKAMDRMHQLAGEAPDAVQEDWATLDGALQDFQTALEDAGLTMDDLAKMQNGEMPENFDPAKLQELAPKLQSLGDQDFQDAADNIEKHAKDECNVDLGSSSS